LICPELDELIEKRIDVLYSFELDLGEKTLRWCQCKVLEVLIEKKKPIVLVHWDPMPDVEGKENSSEETEQVLLPSKWNKNVVGAWRMDINVYVGNVEKNDKRSESNSDIRDESDVEISDSLSEPDTRKNHLNQRPISTLMTVIVIVNNE
jgi:hypothetical protein